MSTPEALPQWLLSLALAGALALVPLAGCSSSEGSGDEGTVETTEETTETAEEAEETKEAEKAEEAPEEEEAVWVLTSVSTKTNRSGEDREYVTTYELDEAGNCLAVHYPETGDWTYSFDEDGWRTQVASGDDAMAYQNEKDEQGRVIRQSFEDGVTEMTYNEKGFIENYTTTAVARTVDENGDFIEGTEEQVVTLIEYDYDGYILWSMASYGDGSKKTVYTYEYDEFDGLARATRCEATTTSYDADDQEIEGTETTSTYTYEYDEQGNISKLTEEDEFGTSVSEYTYTKVEHPSMFVRIDSHLKRH